MITPAPTRPEPHRPHEPRRAPREHDERVDVGREVQRPERVDEACVSGCPVQRVLREEAVNVETAHVEVGRNARPPEECGCDEPPGDQND